MKRFFLATSLFVVTATGGVASAQSGAAAEGLQSLAPPAGAQAPAAAQAAPSAPGPGLNRNILGEPAAPNNIVEEGAPRGELGGLASGAPSISTEVQQLARPAQAGGPAVGVAPGAAAAAPGAAVVTQGSTQATVVEQQTMTTIQDRLVVARVMQHCMFRTLHDQIIAHGGFMPPVIGIAPAFPFPAPPFGDLEIDSVHMAADAIDAKGPLYRVSIRNNSPLVARHFRVSLVAVLGTLDRHSPVATVEMESIPAQGVAHIDVQMPVGVMNLGPEGKTAPFDTLVVAIDSFDELAETHELNNVATLTREAITVVEGVETTTVAPAAAAPAAVAAPAPGTPAAGPPVAAPPAVAPEPAPAPQQQAPQVGPEGNVNLDQLDLERAEGTSQLFSR
jgi:hypothetical protein